MILNANHVGRTRGGQFTRRPLWEVTEDDFPPDSNYWKGRAQAAIDSLLEKEGSEAVECWFDITIDHQDNWRSICEKANKRIHDLSLAEIEVKS